MTDVVKPLYPRSRWERLGAALLFLCALLGGLGLLIGLVVFAAVRRRRPFAAAAGLQVAGLQLLFTLLVGALFLAVAGAMGGMAGLANWMGLVNNLLQGIRVYLLPLDRLFIGVFAGIIGLQLAAAVTGGILALTGRLLPVPVPPARLRRWVGKH
ncbi:MAG TPA: hypothetical protein PK794_10630 [Armatimonadota bacterium]|nr:hypothetical protein [Armatimonadota bacterium]